MSACNNDYNVPVPLATRTANTQGSIDLCTAATIPVILYNVPGRTVADLANDTTIRLSEVPGITGMKDATANIERATDLIKRAPREFAIYSGEDSTALALILLGGHGVISVTANVAPRLMHEMCAAALRGDVATARGINMRLLALHQKLFVEANLEALHEAGIAVPQAAGLRVVEGRG